MAIQFYNEVPLKANGLKAASGGGGAQPISHLRLLAAERLCCESSPARLCAAESDGSAVVTLVLDLRYECAIPRAPGGPELGRCRSASSESGCVSRRRGYSRTARNRLSEGRAAAPCEAEARSRNDYRILSRSAQHSLTKSERVTVLHGNKDASSVKSLILLGASVNHSIYTGQLRPGATQFL